MTSREMEHTSYEPPVLTVLGSLHELTQNGGNLPWRGGRRRSVRLIDVNWIPIANCSS